jgi:Uma2 family endonuclease
VPGARLKFLMGSSSGRIPPGEIRLTYEDYLDLPDDGKHYEILDGELSVTATPVIRHQRVSRNLGFLLHAHVQGGGLGEILKAPVTVMLAETTVVEPDLVFVSTARSGIIGERAIEGPPDLVIEILSPSTARRDRVIKMKLYARYGVDHYWIVDPEARILEIFERRGRWYREAGSYTGDERFRSALLPGLAVDLGRVWA